MEVGLNAIFRACSVLGLGGRGWGVVVCKRLRLVVFGVGIWNVFVMGVFLGVLSNSKSNIQGTYQELSQRKKC